MDSVEDSPSPPACPTSSSCVYSYTPPWPTYSLAWSSQPDARFRLALGSFIEAEANRIQVVEVNPETNQFEVVSKIEHTYPPTKLMWAPPGCPPLQDGGDILASTCVTLNLMRLRDGQLEVLSKLANTRNSSSNGSSPPLTSFDWSAVDPNKIGASSVDSTCTIWNLERSKIETQLIAHDKAVHDIVFARNSCLFASVGADGSVRLFDQRNLDHSTIIYEAPSGSPLLRLAWNSMSTQHLATIAADASGVILIDIRKPSYAMAALKNYDCCVNSIKWAPHTRNHLLCGTDDGHAMIWDVQETGQNAGAQDVVYWHDCKTENVNGVQQVQWPSSAPDHVALGMADRVDIVKI